MNARDLIGKSEGQLLEFKAADALKNPAKVAREVVAMLNASTGRDVAEIWIGVGERESVAVELEGVADAERERSRLRDHIVDTIEPRPTSEEVDVTIEAADSGTKLIKVAVRSTTGRKPFALNKDGRHYWRRVQDRLAPMTYDELRDAWSERGGSGSSSAATASDALRKRRELALKSPDRGGVFWMGVACAPASGADLPSEDIERLLTDPRASGNRPQGWTFLQGPRAVEPTLRGVRVGDTAWGLTEIAREGVVEFRIPLERLRFRPDRPNPEENEISPYALVEYPTSLLRLTAKLAESWAAERYVVALAMGRASEWTLWPFAPERVGWKEERFGCGRFDEGSDLVLDPPLEFTRDEIVATPDACAYRLLVRVYEAFHLGADKMPREFDPVTRRLLLD